jgi:predicted nucleotide-binding protein
MEADDHFGEMSLIDPRARRSASILAIEQTVVAKISEPTFTELAMQFPEMWRRLARCLADRLRKRNDLIRIRNPRPVLFIGSSKEALDVVQEIQNGLRYDDFVVRPWTTGGVFGASKFSIESLERQVMAADFAALVLSPDDVVASRNSISSAPRDNVIFELGLFMGALTSRRTFMISPIGRDIKIPSDLLGFTPIQYKDGPPETLAERIGPVCYDLRKEIRLAGAK